MLERATSHRYAPMVAFMVLAIAGAVGLGIVQHRNDGRQDRAAAVRVFEIRHAVVQSCERVNFVREQVNRNTRTLRRLERVLLTRAANAVNPGFRIGRGELAHLLSRTHTVLIPDCERVVSPVP